MRGLPSDQTDRRMEGSLWTPRGLMAYTRRLPRKAVEGYKGLSKTSKKTIWIVTAAHFVALFLVILITPTRIGHWFNSFALHLRSMGVGGMFILGFLVVISSHPPLIGFSGSMSLIGFTWGMWPGALIAAISTLIGSAIAFVSVRRFFLNVVKKRSNAQWDAFGRVMREKGLPLIIMIRFCPVPWAISNGLFASVESVKFWQFMLATTCLLPRLMIPVFIGSRLVSLTEESPKHDPAQFWLNLFSIGLSFLFSVATGWWIYRLTLEQMRKMDREGDHGGEMAADALENGGLLDDYEYTDEDVREDLTGTERGHPLRPNGGTIRRTSSSGASV